MRRSLLCKLLGAAGLLWGGLPWSVTPANASPVPAPNLAKASYLQFDVPGSVCIGRHPVCTGPVSVNAFGAVTGFYSDSTDGGNHGFVRSPKGVFTEFTAPGATCGDFSDCTVPAASTSSAWL